MISKNLKLKWISKILIILHHYLMPAKMDIMILKRRVYIWMKNNIINDFFFITVAKITPYLLIIVAAIPATIREAKYLQ